VTKVVGVFVRFFVRRFNSDRHFSCPSILENKYDASLKIIRLLTAGVQISVKIVGH
jgi:hypothetical protein